MSAPVPGEAHTCARCGKTGICTLSNDFYTTPFWPEPGHICTPCFQYLVTVNTGITQFRAHPHP